MGRCRTPPLLSDAWSRPMWMQYDGCSPAGTRSTGGYGYGVASFALHGETFEYLKPDPGHQPEGAKSWTYGQYPKVGATLPLTGGGTVTVLRGCGTLQPLTRSCDVGGQRAARAWDLDSCR